MSVSAMVVLPVFDGAAPVPGWAGAVGARGSQVCEENKKPD